MNKKNYIEHRDFYGLVRTERYLQKRMEEETISSKESIKLGEIREKIDKAIEEFSNSEQHQLPFN
jgi:hypothetical protein